MEPSQIRSRILSDHERLRRDLDRLAALVGEARGDSAVRATLLTDTESLLARLHAHMHWEDSYLLPALREADAWGAERAERLTRDHREQRELLDFLNFRLREQARPLALLIREVEHVIELLREDMREEEAELLDERVLRDDVIAIDVQTG
jgi:iron-sulfur cluster repair protein YtfE (RIC family)